MSETKTTNKKESRQFQAETRQLLDLMVHSLYTHKEVFLRELLSNASDAIDKVRFKALTDTSLLADNEDLEIWLAIDKDGKTISVSDNGIGMTYDEVIENIGTIAQSGSKTFLKALQDQKDNSSRLDLIGQFGVGFYSSFMVADKVTIETRASGDVEGVRWESGGEGTYTIEPFGRGMRGTTVTLHLREDMLNPDNPREDFLNQYTIQNLVKKYSDFINYPIKMEFEVDDYANKKEGEQPEKKIQVKTLNSRTPLWERPKSEVKEDEYFQFFKHHFHDWNEPQEIIHIKVEGQVQYTALLYIPSKAPYNFYAADYKKGLQLYSKHVFVMDSCMDLLPDHLRFVRGLVDSPDFSLNVSREILQHDRQIRIIAKNLEKKVMECLKNMLTNERKKYEEWWQEFGKAIKGGIYMEYSNKEKLQDLLLFPTSLGEDKVTTLKEYIERMPEFQKDIYYEVGKDRAAIERLPQMEVIREKEVEVLFFLDKVDEFLTTNLSEYEEKKLKSVSRGDFDLDDKKEDKKGKKDEKSKKDEPDSPHKELLAAIKDHLGDKVREVRLSKRLKSSPVCLVSSESGPSFQMEMLLKEANQSMGKAARILELNPDHETFRILVDEFARDKKSKIVANYSELLLSQALLIEGLALEDPVAFANRLTELMVTAQSVPGTGTSTAKAAAKPEPAKAAAKPEPAKPEPAKAATKPEPAKAAAKPEPAKSASQATSAKAAPKAKSKPAEEKAKPAAAKPAAKKKSAGKSGETDKEK